MFVDAVVLVVVPDSIFSRSLFAGIESSCTWLSATTWCSVFLIVGTAAAVCGGLGGCTGGLTLAAGGVTLPTSVGFNSVMGPTAFFYPNAYSP